MAADYPNYSLTMGEVVGGTRGSVQRGDEWAAGLLGRGDAYFALGVEHSPIGWCYSHVSMHRVLASQ